MITTVFECVSNGDDHQDSEMVSIGFMAEYFKGGASKQRVNLVMATSDEQTPEYFTEGSRYIVTFTKKSSSNGVMNPKVEEKL